LGAAAIDHDMRGGPSKDLFKSAVDHFQGHFNEMSV